MIKSGEAGFSLVEAIVCLAIAALIMTAFFSTTSTNVQLSSRSIGQSKAALIIHRLVNQVGSEIPIEPLSRRGAADDETAWELQINLADISELGQQARTRLPLYRISITITDRRNDRVLETFETYRMGKA